MTLNDLYELRTAEAVESHKQNIARCIAAKDFRSLRMLRIIEARARNDFKRKW